MFTGFTLVVFGVAAACAVLGSCAFFYMEYKIAKKGYRVKLFNNVKDMFNVYTHYRRLSDEKEAPMWPARVLLVAVSGMGACILYVVVAAVIYSHR
jgi:hypothetical protein